MGEGSGYPAVAGLLGVEPPGVQQIVENGEWGVPRGRVVRLPLWGLAVVQAEWSVGVGWVVEETEEEEAAVHLLVSGGGPEAHPGVR